MGRYYSGDIEGKFWFGVQNSNAADRFGVTGCEPSVLEYYFDEDSLEDVEAEIARIEEGLRADLERLEAFFKERNGYSLADLEEAEITPFMLSEYADLRLGRKIRDRLKETGECSFTAEC